MSGVVAENVTALRIPMAGRPPLPRGTSVTRVVALDAAGRMVAESARDPPLSHPVYHVFR